MQRLYLNFLLAGDIKDPQSLKKEKKDVDGNCEKEAIFSENLNRNKKIKSLI